MSILRKLIGVVMENIVSRVVKGDFLKEMILSLGLEEWDRVSFENGGRRVFWEEKNNIFKDYEVGMSLIFLKNWKGYFNFLLLGVMRKMIRDDVEEEF